MDVGGTNTGVCLERPLSTLSNHPIESYQSKIYRIVNKDEIKLSNRAEHQNYLQDTSRSPATGRKSERRRKNTICIVEDEADVGLTLKLILEEKGYRVDLFSDPLIAAEIIKASRYDLFLIDIIMPDLNGFQIFKEIMRTNKKAKVCFITAFEEYSEIFEDESSRLGISGFIRKPVEGDKLIKHVNKMLSTRKD